MDDLICGLQSACFLFIIISFLFNFYTLHIPRHPHVI